MPILQWLDRDKTIKQAGRVPYRLLEVDTNLSYGDKNSQNMLIQGDNLEALKVLLPYYAGKVKCIYIDPPYNTGSAFEHYDDNLAKLTLYYFLSMVKTAILAAAAYSHLKVLTLSDKPSV